MAKLCPNKKLKVASYIAVFEIYANLSLAHFVAEGGGRIMKSKTDDVKICVLWRFLPNVLR